MFVVCWPVGHYHRIIIVIDARSVSQHAKQPEALPQSHTSSRPECIDC